MDVCACAIGCSCFVAFVWRRLLPAQGTGRNNCRTNEGTLPCFWCLFGRCVHRLSRWLLLRPTPRIVVRIPRKSFSHTVSALNRSVPFWRERWRAGELLPPPCLALNHGVMACVQSCAAINRIGCAECVTNTNAQPTGALADTYEDDVFPEPQTHSAVESKTFLDLPSAHQRLAPAVRAHNQRVHDTHRLLQNEQTALEATQNGSSLPLPPSPL
jgi:hypothetical protein